MAEFVKKPGPVKLPGVPLKGAAAKTGPAPKARDKAIEGLEPGPDGLPPDLSNYAAVAGIKPEKELTEAQKKLKAATKREQEQRYQNTSSEFWIALTFQSREQKEAFIKGMLWEDLGSDKYIDGELVAQQFEIELPPAPRRNRLRQNRVYLPFTMPLPSGHEHALDQDESQEGGDEDEGVDE